MLEPQVYERHKQFFQACEQGDTQTVQSYIRDNASSIFKDDIIFKAAIATVKHDQLEVYKQIIEFSEPTIHAANVAKKQYNLSETNQCVQFGQAEVKKHDRQEAISDTFENFKIMGQLVFGLAAMATVELIKVGATLAQSGNSHVIEQMSKMRAKSFPSSSNNNKPDSGW